MTDAPRSIESALTDELADGERPIAGRLLHSMLVADGLKPEPHHTGGGYFALLLDAPGGTIQITDINAQIVYPAEDHPGWVAFYYADEDGYDENGREIYMSPGLPHGQDTALCVQAVTAWLATSQT